MPVLLGHPFKKQKDGYADGKGGDKKKAAISPMDMPTSLTSLVSLRLISSERRITPIISSRMAAVITDVPTLLLSLPSSLSVATVMLTEVAARIVCRKRGFPIICLCVSDPNPPLKAQATKNPSPSGNTTPNIVITTDAPPVLFNLPDIRFDTGRKT